MVSILRTPPLSIGNSHGVYLDQDGCARYKLPVFPEGHEDIDASIYLAGLAPSLGALQNKKSTATRCFTNENDLPKMGQLNFTFKYVWNFVGNMELWNIVELYGTPLRLVCKEARALGFGPYLECFRCESCMKGFETD